MKASELIACIGCQGRAAEKWAEAITEAMDKYAINTPIRQAAFLAQIGHESGLLSIVEENLRYSAEGLLKTFSKYFNMSEAATYAKQPILIASRVYADRMGNGDEASQDGWRYRGRGL